MGLGKIIKGAVKSSPLVQAGRLVAKGAEKATKGGWGTKLVAATGVGGLATLGLLSGNKNKAEEGTYPPGTGVMHGPGVTPQVPQGPLPPMSGGFSGGSPGVSDTLWRSTDPAPGPITDTLWRSTDPAPGPLQPL